MEVTGEVEVKCKCPKCGYEYVETQEVELDVDMSDYASDSSWRD